MGVKVGTITGLVIGIVMLVVLFQVANSVIPTGAIAYHNLTDTLAGGGAYLGTDAASISGSMDTWVGYFWVLGPFVLVISLVLGMFLGRGRR